MAKKSDADLLLKLSGGSTPDGFYCLKNFLYSAISYELLFAEYKKKCARQGHRDSPVIVALWEGYFSLLQNSEERAKQLRDRGQLLFAFAGTTVLQGGAS